TPNLGPDGATGADVSPSEAKDSGGGNTGGSNRSGLPSIPGYGGIKAPNPAGPDYHPVNPPFDGKYPGGDSGRDRPRPRPRPRPSPSPPLNPFECYWNRMDPPPTNPYPRYRVR